MEVIRLTSVSKAFHGRPIYSSATATFESGKITAIVGPNGSGKSLLFRMICGLVRPDEGNVWVEPAYLSGGRDFPDRFGIIIDRPGFIEHRSGLANLQELARIRKRISEPEISASMERFGLDPSLKQRVRHYSLGMRQRLALAQAFMESPEVLILDEPFNALDAEMVIKVQRELRDFRDNGGTVIFASHNQSDVDHLADCTLEVRGERLSPVLAKPA